MGIKWEEHTAQLVQSAMSNIIAPVTILVDQDKMCDHFRAAIGVDPTALSNKTINNRFAMWKSSVGLVPSKGPAAVKGPDGDAVEKKQTAKRKTASNKEAGEKKPAGEKRPRAKKAKIVKGKEDSTQDEMKVEKGMVEEGGYAFGSDILEEMD